MESDSGSSCEDRLRDLEGGTASRTRNQRMDRPIQTEDSLAWHPSTVCSPQPQISARSPGRSLSTQVMEYYQKYSKNSNLDQYFSLPTSANASTNNAVKYYYSIYEVNSKLATGRHDASLSSEAYVPRERRRWVRPPVVGQSSNIDCSGIYVPISKTTQNTKRSLARSPDLQSSNLSQETILEEEKSDRRDTISEVERKERSSPTSSVASHKPLEWDSGADVGYHNAIPRGDKENNKKLSTIERMALATGCSAALRLDPEGTNENCPITQTTRLRTAPAANSTAVNTGNVSESENELEITPIVKNHPPGIITGDDIKSVEQNREGFGKTCEAAVMETPKSIFKVPISKPKPSEEGNCGTKRQNGKEEKNSSCPTSPMKKSTSMNVLSSSNTGLALKKSQSELNLNAKDKPIPALIFNSTSSIATIVNKPMTSDKFIQTSVSTTTHKESIGVQVSVIEEEKPPLPKRGSSLAQKSLQSILKNPKNTYKIDIRKETRRMERKETRDESGSTSSTPGPLNQADNIENVTGRANSFEYFPGHIYENVATFTNNSDSHASSINTARSNSTMPNTSSSIDEKLWGNSDSLVRDLERSVNILKSLVDANKCDKQVKKRLIHHVVKRLVSTNYMDDKIQRDLEENVPWNPDDARNKVYRTEILQALAKKQNTTDDTSDDWKASGHAKRTGCSKKRPVVNVARVMNEMINLESSNESSDKFERNTDRTEMDGRKARMGLRVDDCQDSSNTLTDDRNKSESSECFLPQRSNRKSGKVKNSYPVVKKCEDHNRLLLDTVVNNKQAAAESSAHSGSIKDWRIPTTMSEREFNLRRCSNSDSADSKLLSYAEMEKKNQLLWITNEISHLSNLKKLLEQPKKLERSRYSPRKSKLSMCRANPASQQANGESNCVNLRYMNEQWSSHGNLAAASCSRIGSERVLHLRKRNSCTQTATGTIESFSKIGGEVIMSLQKSDVKSINVSVQTFEGVTENCPIHGAMLERTCKCGGESYQRRQQQQQMMVQNVQVCPRHSKLSKEGTDVLSNCCKKETSSESEMRDPKRKETKNKLNATKSRYIDNANSSCLCNKVCEVCHSKEIQPMESKRLYEKRESLPTVSVYERRRTCSNERKTCTCNQNGITKPWKYEAVEEKGRENTSCFKLPIVQRNNPKCNCDKECSCANKIRDIQDKLNDCEENLKCCRSCGVMYQNDRKCHCRTVYPKAVAYELSFEKSTQSIAKHSSSEHVGVNSLSRMSSNNSLQRIAKSNGCTCDGNKDEKVKSDCRKKTNTLQDYLTSNKPEFVDNVETRQHYLSEISHLRQLRKEKRLQLLTIASSTNLNPQRPINPVVTTQKKISDAEMKERLRRRYLRLNEVRSKRRQLEKQEEAKRNKLMAKIFCKKLQQKVLRGQVDLSQSVSVISNL